MIEELGKIERIIQESVPGKQITLAHVIAAPIEAVYESLGVEHNGAIGIVSLTPNETAIIAADIAGKAANVDICFVDRFTGSVMCIRDRCLMVMSKVSKHHWKIFWSISRTP